MGAPLLIPLKDEIILDLNDNFTLRCEDSEPITWKYPVYDGVIEDTYTPEDPKRTYGITLVLNNVNYQFVGNYYCIKSSSVTREIMEDAELTNLANANLASSIYIYVNGKKHCEF